MSLIEVFLLKLHVGVASKARARKKLALRVVDTRPFCRVRSDLLFAVRAQCGSLRSGPLLFRYNKYWLTNISYDTQNGPSTKFNGPRTKSI